MIESFILVATLTLVNGEQVEAYGEEYPTYEECLKANEKEMKHIMADIRKRPNVFKDMDYRCERYVLVYPEGVMFNE